MMVYDSFAETRGWDPRIVDELSLDELEWLPIITRARMVAREQLSDE